MRDFQELDRQLRRIDGSSYGAYKALKGSWVHPEFELIVDYVQGDPFATPSRMRVVLSPQSARYPEVLLAGEARRLGVAAAVAREASSLLRRRSGRSGSGHSGEIRITDPGQVVGRQTAVLLHPDGTLEARLRIGLPADGRRILGRAARSLLFDELPGVVGRALVARSLDPEMLRRAAEVNEDQEALRAALAGAGLVAFLAEGSGLPRRSGRDDRPLEGDAVVPLQIPESRRVVLEAPNAGPVVGLGIPEGITLVVGGGFHGKSTLLRAISTGVRNHCPGDGRERVVTRADAVKVRAEDGRAVAGVDISPFIDELPGGRGTGAFTTENASGSTSQAAAISEALEIGAGALLIDEDTAATNFMIRDRRMQALVPGELEPITPFVDRIRDLHREAGVHAILVLGGSGDYLDVADTVLAMTDFVPSDVTARAREVADAHPTGRLPSKRPFRWARAERVPARGCVSARKGRRDRRIRVHAGGILEFGTERIDLSALEQIESEAEMRSVGYGLALAGERWLDGAHSIPEIVDAVLGAVNDDGLDALDGRHLGDLAEIRRFELAAALNRLRTLTLL